MAAQLLSEVRLWLDPVCTRAANNHLLAAAASTSITESVILRSFSFVCVLLACK